MRVLYADTGLRGLEGHITSSGLALPPALRRLGHDVTVFGHQDMVPALREATGAVRLFRYYTWDSRSNDPLIGWLTDFASMVDATLVDLHRGWAEYGPFDLIYINTGRAVQLAAAGLWLKDIYSDEGAVPAIAVQLGPDPGLVRSGPRDAPVFTVRDPTTVLHRYAAHLIGKEWLNKMTLMAVNETVAEEYGFIVDTAIKPLTTPEELPPTRRRRPGGTLTIGFLGYQRIEKGYELLPDLIEQLLQRHASVHFLVQHSDPLALAQEHPERNLAVTEKLRELASRNRRVELVLEPRVGNAWFDLIGRCDMIALPYDPVRYASGYSAIFGEALASGTPIVAPAGTTMAAEIDKLGGVGVPFSQWTVPFVASAISLAVNAFDDLAERAYQGGLTWRTKHGPDAYVAQVMQAAGFDRAAGPSRSFSARVKRVNRQLPAAFLGNAQLQNGASFKPDGDAFEYTGKAPSARNSQGFLRRRRPRPIEAIKPPLEVIDRTIVTGAQWQYSLTFDVNAELARNLPANSELAAEAIVEVEGGAIGVAWIDRENRLASPEQFVYARAGTQRVVVSASSDRAQRLMLRNVVPDRTAVFTLRRLRSTANIVPPVEPGPIGSDLERASTAA